MINISPRDGGNTFHGSWYSNYANSGCQANNRTAELEAKGLLSQNRNGGLYDINPWFGGPLRRDKLWFIASYRDVYVKEIVANSFYDDRSPGYSKSNTRNASLRLTWQATINNKVSFHYDRQFKRLPSILNAGQDAETGGVQRFPRDYPASLVKWMSTRGGRWLFDTGWGTNHETYLSTYLDGVDVPRGTPEWFARASRFDTVLNTRTTAGTGITGDYPTNDVLTHATSYVTGSHTVKIGTQWRYGTYRHTDDAHADLIQQYLNGVPDTVSVRNTPTSVEEHWNAARGIYGQDSWVFRRMTANLGIRWEYFNGRINAQDAPGRFVPARHFDETGNMPNWTNWSPRVGVVFDLFGDGKTALKLGANRYNQGQALGFARRYNPMAMQTDTRIWRDVDLLPGTTTAAGLSLPTNGDDIAQDNEIGDGDRLICLGCAQLDAKVLALDEYKPAASVLWKGNSDNEIQTDGLHATTATPVIIGDQIYGLCSYGQFRCLRVKTGERLWETQLVTKERARWASGIITRHGDRLFINNDCGELVIVAPAPDGYHEMSRTQLIKPTSPPGNRRQLVGVNWSSPADANRHIYDRNDEEIIAASLAVDGK